MEHISEGHFKETVLKDLRLIPGLYFLKTQEMSRRGVPDLLICYKGQFVAIELKIEGEKPTKLQALKLDEIKVAGGLAFYTTPSNWKSDLANLVHFFEQTVYMKGVYHGEENRKESS